MSLECTAVHVRVVTRVHAAWYKWQLRIFPRLRFVAPTIIPHSFAHSFFHNSSCTQFGPKFLRWIHAILQSLEMVGDFQFFWCIGS